MIMTIRKFRTLIETIKNYDFLNKDSYIIFDNFGNKKLKVNNYYCVFYEDNYAVFQHKLNHTQLVVIKREQINSVIINKYEEVAYIFDKKNIENR